MYIIENKLITSVNEMKDGISLCDGYAYSIRNCIIDLSSKSLDEIDEAIGITWGSSACISNCIIRGAGKLILCGSGDKDKMCFERGKKVTFSNCILEDFGRRGPEVQCGMWCELHRCLIRNWGHADRFDTRSFGAWSHTDGSYINATDCIFWQDHMFNRHFIKDLINHIGQAWNDSGIKGLFSMDAWRPGNWRGLIASDGGNVHASNCYRNHRWIRIDNLIYEMPEQQAFEMLEFFDDMAIKLERICGI